MQEYPRKSWWCQEVGPSKSHAPSSGDQLSPCQPTGKLLPPGGRGGITPGCSGGSGGAQLPAELLGAPCPLSGGRGGMPGAADSRSGSGMGERQPSPPSGPDRCRNKCSVGSSTSLHFRPPVNLSASSTPNLCVLAREVTNQIGAYNLPSRVPNMF